MAFGLGFGLCFGRGISAASVLPFSIPISPSAWSTREATDDADTRKVYVQLNIAEEAEYLFGVYRGTNAAGNLTQIGQMSHDGTRYTWQSSGQASPGSTNFTRLAYRPSDLSAGWAWLTDAFDTKPFTISDVPGAPSFTWAPLSTGSVRLTIATPITNGRTVTAGAYQIDGGSFTSFTPATTLDVTGLTDGVATDVGLRWTNVNGDSGVTTVSVTAEAPAPVPPAPDVTYTVDGSGTAATLYLDTEETGVGEILSIRYAIDGGSAVVVSGAGPVDLTGLSASQDIAVEWANANGYSAATTITVVAALPTYGAGDWSLADAETGDILTVTVTADPTSAAATFVSRQYRVGAGAWAALPASGEIATGAVDVAANVQLRAVYDIGPGVASDTKTATPTSPAMEPVRAVIRSRGAGASAATASTTHTYTLPAGAQAGDMAVYVLGFNGDPGSLTVSSGTGWTVTEPTLSNGSDNQSIAFAYKELTGTGDALVLTSANSQQSSFLSWAQSTWGGDPIFSTIYASAINEAPNSPNLPFGGDLPFVVITAGVSSQSNGIQTAAPSGYSQFRNQNSNTNGSTSCRTFAAEREVDGTSEDPGAWPVSVPFALNVTIGFPPATSIAATDTLTTTVSATAIENGQSVTFTAQANGNPNITYELTIDGTTETIVAPNNLPATFTVTPSTGSQAWTLTASNAAGSDSDSGTITVAENLIFTTSGVNALALTVQADSVSHTVTPASYELEWDTVGGSAPTTIAQVSPTVALTLPDYGAYQFRVRAIDAGDVAGDWSDYKYYWAMQQDRITWRGENAAAVQISPLSTQAPIEVVPVSGRQVRVYEVWPAVVTEVHGGATHYLNGVMVNPAAGTGRGPQGLDSRQGDGTNITQIQSGFDLALVNTSWPVIADVGTTVWKIASRPTAQLDSIGLQGFRSGLPDQHAGLVVKAALSTPSPIQAAPGLVKGSGWVSTSVALPNFSTMLDALVASNLSTSGMTLPNTTVWREKICRFDPAIGLLTGGTWGNDSEEPLRPYNLKFGGSANNYRAFGFSADAFCLMLSDAVDSDWIADVFAHEILRGIQWDQPGIDARTGAGISLDRTFNVMLARMARGVSFDDLETSQRDIMPYMYDFWTTETLAYLNPHDDITRPVFARWKTPSVITDDAIGHQLTFSLSITSRSWERKQRIGGLEVLRENTGERLPVRNNATDVNNTTPLNVQTTGFFSTPPTTSERYCLQIPSAAMGAFAVGEPFWMYDTEAGGDDPMAYRWNSFNPSATMAYREEPAPQHLILAHRFFEGAPTAGSHFDAQEKYALRARQPDWPSAAMNYPFNASTFVTQFWDAHAAGLGITL